MVKVRQFRHCCRISVFLTNNAITYAPKNPICCIEVKRSVETESIFFGISAWL